VKDSKGQSILVVEDETSIASFVAMYLKNAGYTVRTSATGGDALTQVAAEAPDLVVLDLMLPDIDGVEICRRIRQRSDLPVLMLTARDEDVDKIIGLEVGADDYLTKPFGTRELIARIRALLRRHERLQEMISADHATPSAALRLGPLELDPEGRVSRLDGEPLDLTRTEFELLHLLLRNRGRAFSRAYLHHAVWGEPAVEGDRSVDNAVLRLRRKLRSMGDAIETVWGVGYRLSGHVTSSVEA
jgi:DNA-binding response OmpR family regulator